MLPVTKFISFLSIVLIFSPLPAYSAQFIGSPSITLNIDGSLEAKGMIGQVQKNINILIHAGSGSGDFRCNLIGLMGDHISTRANDIQNGTFNVPPDKNQMVSFDLNISAPIAKYNIHDSCESNFHDANVKGVNVYRILTNMTYRDLVLSVQEFANPSVDILTKKWAEIVTPGTSQIFSVPPGITTKPIQVKPPVTTTEERVSKPGSSVTILPGSSSQTTGKYFEPASLTVSRGTTVTWINDDTTLHTVTSGNPKSGNSGTEFDSSYLASGKIFQHQFQQKGTFDYYCTLHPWMTGKVVVN